MKIFLSTMWALVVALFLAGTSAFAEDPPYPHGNFRADCKMCHQGNSWRPAHAGPEFDHSKFGFALIGAHSGTPCLSCHQTLTFETAKGSQCKDCHEDTHLGSMGNECEQCHSTQSFVDRAKELRDHSLTRFPLTGSHTGADCASCHKPNLAGNVVFANTPTECAACHMAEYESAESPNHVAQGFSTDCAGCHKPSAWAGATFDHAETGFPLTGAHVSTRCTDCHGNTGGQFTAVDPACVACHQQEYNATTNPNHLTSGLPTTCVQCHNTTTWGGGNFDHAITGFPLTGAHAPLQCVQCHLDGTYAGRDPACVACHREDFQSASDPNHVAAGFATECIQCHGTASWSGSSFDHSVTGFTLTGAHTPLECMQCHGDGVYAGRDPACVACHQSDYNGTTDPNHVAAAISTDCLQCHGTTAWAGATFDHTVTGFALTGAHAPLECMQCHGDGVYAGRDPACLACHQSDYNGATDPNHVASGFPTDCLQCHGTASWSGATFNHNTTGFPLTGAHAPLQCMECHGDGVYVGRDPACVACHQSDFNGATDPNHVASGFPTDCIQCHGTTSWSGASFNHNTTGFPLTGAHAPLQCMECHGDGVYVGRDPACVACHQSDFNGATDPNHVASGFPTDCIQCHGTTSWSGASFNHNTTGFPLTGAHAPLQCMECHGDGVYVGRDPACVACHQADYNGTTDPNHVAAAISTDCIQCHGTSTWSGASFDHNATGFPLNGAHAPLECMQCHGDGVYVGRDPACVACHQADYNGATDPNHVASGFPTDCIQCHGTSTWSGASFNHNATGFPLTGAHAPLQCMECHGDGVYVGRDPACIACHQSDYNGATDPNHITSGFGTDCITCHDTTQWDGATFDHDSSYFPIYTGRHRNEWQSCADCHTNQNNYSVFTCLSCHPHSDKNKTDGDHRGENGYSYTSSACYNCHPRGNS